MKIKVNLHMRVCFLILVTTPILISGEIEALILARGGSKGVHLKNLKLVGGVSLLASTVQTARIAGLNVTVSTDHPVIALEAIHSGATVFCRSKVTATDWAPSIWGAAEFVAARPQVEILVLLQATSPFIRAEHLRHALKKIKHCDCVFSVVRSFKLRWREANDDHITPLNFELGARPRRQDWKGELLETGAFYLTRRNVIESGYFQNNNCSVIEVSSAESLEVDTFHDLQVANALLGTT